MQLLVESGATKSNWVVLGLDGVKSTTRLEGINPNSNPDSIHQIDKFGSGENIDKVHYYGAGVTNNKAEAALTAKLQTVFPEAIIHVNSDILAAARSTSYGYKSIVSILGTGTNTAVYDGYRIVDGLKAMGYLFTDYGSGFHIGKEIVTAYYRKEMSEKDAKLFEETFITDPSSYLYDIYRKSKPNKTIASCARFLDVASKDFRNKILDIVFEMFYLRQIDNLQEYHSYPLNFVGSVSFAFKDKLQEFAINRNRKIKNIIGDPLDGLIQYHLRHS